LRAPITRLIVHDPYFGVWSMNDHLTDDPARHWTGSPQPINGIIRVDHKSWRYLGDAERSLPALEETHRDITATRTIATLKNPQIELRLCFFTLALPNDLAVMARPVTYLTWEVHARDGAPHRHLFRFSPRDIAARV
jgi:hypothetical protein